MKREILINANPRETRVAIIEDDQLVELLVDRPEARRMVGDIYLGRVEAVLPGIQAAFVDIGTEKSAFLHASDLVFPEDEPDDDDDDDDDEDDDKDAESEGGSSAGGGGGGGRGRRRRAKAPPIQDVLKRGQDLIVQVSKEPISTKGPRVTAQVSMAGRFLVYMPFAERVGVSRKIGEREVRKRPTRSGGSRAAEEFRRSHRPNGRRRRHAGDARARADHAHRPVEEDQAKDPLRSRAVSDSPRDEPHSRPDARRVQHEGRAGHRGLEAGAQRDPGIFEGHRTRTHRSHQAL
jgi:ribonuclease G